MSSGNPWINLPLNYPWLKIQRKISSENCWDFLLNPCVKCKKSTGAWLLTPIRAKIVVSPLKSQDEKARITRANLTILLLCCSFEGSETRSQAGFLLGAGGPVVPTEIFPSAGDESFFVKPSRCVSLQRLSCLLRAPSLFLTTGAKT